MSKNEFGVRLKNWMRANNVTAGRLADEAGINANTVGNWLHGKVKPTWAKAAGLCQIIGVTEDDFVMMFGGPEDIERVIQNRGPRYSVQPRPEPAYTSSLNDMIASRLSASPAVQPTPAQATAPRSGPGPQRTGPDDRRQLSAQIQAVIDKLSAHQVQLANQMEWNAAAIRELYELKIESQRGYSQGED